MGIFGRAADGHGYIAAVRVTAGAMLRLRAARQRLDAAARAAGRAPFKSETEFLAWVFNQTTAKVAFADDEELRRVVERWRPAAAGTDVHRAPDAAERDYVRRVNAAAARARREAPPEPDPQSPATSPVVRDGGTARARLGVSTRAPTEQQAGATPEGYHEIEDLA